MRKTFISLLALVASVTMFAAERVYDTNLALASNGASATASSGTAANAIDGNNGTRWESASEDPQWLLLDLGQERIFNTIQIRWEGAYTKAFTISVSTDGEAYTTIQTINRTLAAPGNFEEQLEFDEVTARYVRFDATERGTGYGNSFWEFRVLLPGVATLTTLQATAASDLCKVGAEDAITVVAKDQNGTTMDAGTLTYVVTPAAAGTVTDGKFVAAQAGAASIVVKAGEVSAAAVSVFVYAGDNVIESTSLATSKIIAQSNENPNGSAQDAFYAIDNNDGSVWQGDPVASGESLETECSFVADLGAYYDIELVSIKFEGACSQEYTVDFSADNATWLNAYTYSGAAGINPHVANIYPGGARDLQNNSKVRYVRFISTKNATQWGMKIFYFKVFGTEWVAAADNVAPVMGTATLVSNTHNQAVIAVAATDDNEVKDYHVVDAAHEINVYRSAVDGNITVTGLAASTAYTFTITARDLALNESENSAEVSVTTAVHYDRPQAAAPVPTVVESRVVKVYSDAYAGTDFASLHNAWGDPTVYEAMAFGEDNVRLYSNVQYFGWGGVPAISCLNMEKLHIDIWAEESGQLGIVPIYGGTDLATDDTHRKIVTLVGQQWNSLDLDLATDFAGLNLASIFQFKFDNATGDHFAIDNVYFYRTSDLADEEAPTAFSATVAEASYFHAVINAVATDNMGAVTFNVYYGTSLLATASSTSGTAVNITVGNLNAGSSYRFTVIASDGSNNEAAPVYLDVRTLTAPAAAPTPTHDAEDVLAIFSDVYTIATSIETYNANWWLEPNMIIGELADDDNALFYYGANMSGTGATIGWQFAGVALDVTGYENLHIDIYPAADCTIKCGPTSLQTEVTLVAGQWNSFNLDMSALTNKALEQFQFTSYAAVGTMFVDNVYFFRTAEATALEAVETADVQKLMINGQVYILREGVMYNALGQIVR